MHTPLLLDIAADACADRVALGSRDGGCDFVPLRSPPG